MKNRNNTYKLNLGSRQPPHLESSDVSNVGPQGLPLFSIVKEMANNHKTFDDLQNVRSTWPKTLR